jgi:4-amino-4-deoxy-L-arabinose transferase-like glycosyltransferase
MKTNLLKKNWFHVIVIILLGSLLYGYNISGWDLWNPDEPRYAQVAREMAETGNWTLPHLNGDVYHEKPPLVFWLTGLSFKLFGSCNEFTARFPTVILSVLILVATYFFCRMMFDPVTGFLSSLVLATNIEYFWLSRRLCLDIPITLFILLSLFSFYRAYRGEKGKRLYYALFFISMGLATLAKGPVGFIIPLLTVIIYLALEGEIRRLKEMRFGLGFFLFLLTLSAWLIPAALQGGMAYFQEIVFRQTVNRFFDAWAHRQPFYYYFQVFPAGFAPWIVFFPLAFIWCFQAWRKKRSGDYLFPLVWFLVVFTFFSSSTGKRELYLLPLYPAAAMIIGRFWADYCACPEDQPLKRFMNIPLFVFMGSMLAGGILPFFLETRFHTLLESAPQISFKLIALSCAVTAFLLFIFRKRKQICFALIVVIMSCGIIYGVHSILPFLNPFKSARPLSSEIISLMKPGDELVIYRRETSAFNFYTGIYPIKQIKSQEDLSTLFTSDKRIFCLIQKGDFEKTRESLLNAYPLKEADIGHRNYLLVSNRNNPK